MMQADATSMKADDLASQFETPEQQRLAARLGMWVFLASEIMFFGAAFFGYTVYRWKYSEAWAESSRHLGLLLGTINTAVLLSSSLTMALAVDAVRTGRRSAVAFLLTTMALGA